MAALRHEETDRVPWSPLVSGYFSLGLPEPVRGNDIEAQRAFGADMMERLLSLVYQPSLPAAIPAFQATGMEPVATVIRSDKVEVRETRKGNQLQRVYETPIGTLKEVYEGRDSSPWMMFPVEYKIKTLEDLICSKVHSVSLSLCRRPLIVS